MGYRDDAYYRLWSDVGEVSNDASNAPFTWPSDRIRFLEAERTLSGNQTHSVWRNLLKRGYIRGLPQPGVHSSTFRPMKCKFQFNPQTIVQTVTMREDVYLSVLQDPVAFTQPFAGSVNFNFDLVFDRSLEVGKGTGSTGVYIPADINNPNYKRDVSDIGVLADLQVLYSIIGQGFSKELLDFQKDRLAQGGRQLINKQGGADTTDANAVTESNIDQRAAEFANDVNLGNAAFLIPNPVRIVFSSLFMVEGFITGTNVDFLKFSTNMVPIQAKVSLSVNAVYIGYARQKTFLTDQLEKAQKAIEEQQRAVEEGKKEIAAFAEQQIGYFGFSTTSAMDGGFVEDVNRRVISDMEYSIVKFACKSSSITVPSAGGGEPYVLGTRTMAVGFLPVPNRALPAFSTLADSNTKVTASWTMKIYGPYPLSDFSTIRNLVSSNFLVGDYSGTIDSSAAPDWGNDWAIQLYGPTESRLVNSAYGGYDSQAQASYWVTNKFYYCVLNATCTVTRSINGEDVSITKSGSYSSRVTAEPTFTDTVGDAERTSSFSGKIPMWGVVSGQRPGDTGV